MRVATLLFEFPQKVLQETSPACQASEGQNSSSYHTTFSHYCVKVVFWDAVFDHSLFCNIQI